MTPRTAQTKNMNVNNLIFDRTETSYSISPHVTVYGLIHYTTGHRNVAPGDIDIPPLAENGSECERVRETVCA